MPRKKSGRLTPLELEIMQVLWAIGPSNVQSVQRELKRDLAYTTVQTMLSVLLRKNKVTRTLKDKAHIYRPAVSCSQASGHAVGDLIDRLFGGSAENLVMNLIETRHLTPAKLARLNELVEKGVRDDKT